MSLLPLIVGTAFVLGGPRAWSVGPLEAVQVRSAEMTDIPSIVQLATTEFLSVEDRDDELLLTALSLQVSFGFEARIQRAAKTNDHNVIVAVDDELDAPQLLGVIEVSLQPPSGATAPTFPTPQVFKQLQDAALRQFNMKPLQPYISNLLIDPRHRRMGHAQELVRACEERAQAWGFNEVYLHVDIDYPPAQQLYEKLGYSTLKQEPAWKKKMNGVQLRFMSKNLTVPLASVAARQEGS